MKFKKIEIVSYAKFTYNKDNKKNCSKGGVET